VNGSECDLNFEGRAQVCYPSIVEAEATGTLVQGQPGLHSETLTQNLKMTRDDLRRI
jgi:hypothetical protein